MELKPTIIAIVRDAVTLETIRDAVTPHGVELLLACDAEAGWTLMRQSRADAIVLDTALADGTALIERIADWDPAAQILLLAEGYTEAVALDAVRRGACGCLGKPFSADTLWQRIEGLLGDTRVRRETWELDERLREACQFQGMVGRSPGMREVFARIRRVAPHYRVALISGATGTGKELVAQALHALSPVASRRLAVCNCSAIVETLFESELFGHVKGAFTGATQDRVGLFEYARGGTVFLDEIADMPLATQSKLLRVVQNQELQRVGSPEVRRVDVRVIAASNRDMRARVSEGLFREDLYYRLSMIELQLPALAERGEDLPLLERHFLARFARRYGKRLEGFSRRAQAVLAGHQWRGNVRELENVVGHACMMAESEFIDVRDLPEYLRHPAKAEPAGDAELIPLSELESRYARHVLERAGGNKLQAAQILGISRATLYRILRDGQGEPRKTWMGPLVRAGGVPARLPVQ